MNSILLTDIGDDDVLLGRGTGPNAHEGNKKFRVLSANLLKSSRCDAAPECATGEQTSKRKMAKKLVDMVHARNGKFVRKLTRDERSSVAHELFKASSSPDTRRLLKKNKQSILGDLYVVVPEEVAIEKAKQSFRHQRRVMLEDGTDHHHHVGTTNVGGGQEQEQEHSAPVLLSEDEEQPSAAGADDETISSTIAGTMKKDLEAGESEETSNPPVVIATPFRPSNSVSLLKARLKSQFREALRTSRLKKKSSVSAANGEAPKPPHTEGGVDSRQRTTSYFANSNGLPGMILPYRTPVLLELALLVRYQDLLRHQQDHKVVTVPPHQQEHPISHHHQEGRNNKRRTLTDPESGNIAAAPLGPPPPLFLTNLSRTWKKTKSAGFTNTTVDQKPQPYLLTSPPRVLGSLVCQQLDEPAGRRASSLVKESDSTRPSVANATPVDSGNEISTTDAMSALLQLKNSSSSLIPFIVGGNASHHRQQQLRG